MPILHRFIVLFLVLPHLILLGREEIRRHPIVREYSTAHYFSSERAIRQGRPGYYFEGNILKRLPFANDKFPGIPYDEGFEGPLLGPIDDSWTNLKIEFSKDRAEFTRYWWKWFIYSANAERSRDLVKEIHITGEMRYAHLDLVEAVFRKIKQDQLKVVRWDLPGPIPKSTLKILEERYSNCRLYYSFNNIHFGYSQSLHAPQHFHSLQVLISSTILYSLRVELHYTYKAEYNHLTHLFSILSTAPNMRELELIIHDLHGCESTSSPFAFNFLAQPSVRFPPLEVLKLDGYDLEERADGGNTWIWEYLDQQAFNQDPDLIPPPTRKPDDGRTSLDAWMEVMDWSHIQTLELFMPSKKTLAKLSGSALPALTKVQLNHGPRTNTDGNTDGDDALSFLTSHPLPLESLSLGGFDIRTGNAILENFLSREESVQNMTHFAFRDSTTNENQVPLNESLLAEFIRRSPKLDSLDINIRRDTNMLVDEVLFTSFTLSPTVTRLTLRIPSPDRENEWWMNHNNARYHYLLDRYRTFKDIGDETDAIFNKNTVVKIFQQIRSRKVGKELEEIEFYVGNWDGRWERGMLSNIILRVAYWKCSANWEGEKCEGNQTRITE
ncbi:hypothetical protein BGZ60DRAFT_420091 [Tricladium varicosporioides]|nr:hypothetical protein BGZ60DRAFT_420091 [Hymenoscyphus varicosporioides]